MGLSLGKSRPKLFSRYVNKNTLLIFCSYKIQNFETVILTKHTDIITIINSVRVNIRNKCHNITVQQQTMATVIEFIINLYIRLLPSLEYHLRLEKEYAWKYFSVRLLSPAAKRPES